MLAMRSWTRVRLAVLASTRVFLNDLGQGLLAVSHNTLALCGLLVVGIGLVLGSRHDMRTALENTALDWLLTRQEARFADVTNSSSLEELTAVDRATATDPTQLTRQQAAVAQWLSRRYRVAPEPVSALVQEAWALGKRSQLEPTLILAIAAIESSFNPFAQSAVGAQGLMQVMTSVHDDKYEPFGGTHAAFDPLTNLRVGVDVLRECIARAGGSLEGGLRMYVGAANLPDDGGYSAKVLAENQFLRQVALGQAIPINVKLPASDASPKLPLPEVSALLQTSAHPPAQAAPLSPAQSSVQSPAQSPVAMPKSPPTTAGSASAPPAVDTDTRPANKDDQVALLH